MKRSEFLDYHLRLTTSAMELVDDKIRAYSGDDVSVFTNFERVEQLEICPTHTGILTRIADKIGRVATYLNSGGTQVGDEGFDDAILDLLNYLVFLHAIIRKEELYDGRVEEMYEVR